MTSLQSGEAVLRVLQAEGYSAQPIYVDREVDLALRQAGIEVAFIALHGRGADGPIQGLLESLAIPYTGSSLAAAALTADRLKTKELLRLHNLPTPAYYCHQRSMGSAGDQHGAFGFPCLVRPRSGPGAMQVDRLEELELAIEHALQWDDEALIERHTEGQLIKVALLDGELLGIAEWRAEKLAAPRIGEERLRGIATQAVRAHYLLGCSGLSLVDLVLSPHGNESLVSIEPFPELRPDSLIARVAARAGIDFGDLIGQILDAARLHSGRRLQERREADVPWPGSDRRAAATESH